MPPKKRGEQHSIALSGEVGPGDGVDPKERERTSSRSPGSRTRSSSRSKGPIPSWVRLPDGSAPPEPAPDRKVLQLCRQVARTLDGLLAGEVRDEALHGLKVVSVVPSPDASNLLVTLELPPSAEPRPASTLPRDLARASGWLRAEVASAITRKRAPNLTYLLAPTAAPPSLDDPS